ncbi:MAG: leucine-rich repeat protein [Lachnospiraceae bacterium]
MKCPNCGTENDGDAVFCKKCGTKIETQSDSEDISWVDKVDFTKGIDWGETDDQPEQKKEEQTIEVDLSQKKRAQMWEDLQRKKAMERLAEEQSADKAERKSSGPADKEKKAEPELDVMPGMKKRRPAAPAQPPKPEEEPEEPLYDDEDDYDFDEYDYQDEEKTDGGRPPVGLFAGIIGVVAAIIVLAIVLFNVFSSNGGGYVPAARPAANASSGTEAATEPTLASATEAAQTTEERTAEPQEATTTAPETTVAETTTEAETTEEETTVEETTEPETTEPEPEPVVQDGLTYHFRGGEAYVGKYTGDAAEIYVASEVNGYPVRYIDADAFSDCYSLQRLYIPEGVVEIGENALYNCTSLNQIVLPSTLTEIGQGAFDYCPAFTIIGQEGTFAQQFADLYHVNFVSGSDFE